jgi:two-component system response regulator AtoC
VEESSVLVVDDRRESRALVASELARAGFRVTQAEDGHEAWGAFRRDPPDLVVSDLRMPRADGLELLRRIRRVSSVPVLLLTAYGDVPTAVVAMRAGASEFMTFPEDLEQLSRQARRLVASRCDDAEANVSALLVGRSPAMRRVRERVRALAPLALPVLVAGERGSGRDRVVQALHALGRPDREADAPLVRVRCGEDAQPAPPPGSVVYLDEVGRLDLPQQACWEQRLRTGNDGGAPPRFRRVYASTCEDLTRRVREGSFLPALARPLSRFTIQLSPLRQRREDVPALVTALVGEIGRSLGRDRCRVQPAALTALKARSWPGNVAELARVLEKLVAFSPGGEISGRRVRAVLREMPESVDSLRRSRKAQQREELVRLLEECGGNLAEVARRLGLSRGAVIYRARRFGLMPERSEPRP